ncbi:SEL1-like repeat protein [Helicobacter bizzozeronii]|uniref:SEL1-like repeat protein n=1 Tax=Helicobacter bizzozeronii TaxID=56877 RepID=UPI001315A843|nr:SEL1-like repeat protein [Helicobacter bizzozeronii]
MRHDARAQRPLAFEHFKTIDVVYGKPTRDDYEVAYSDANEAYLKGIALGSGHCALELAHLELEQPKHFKMKPEKKQNALLEANHRAIGYFKQALEWGYNTAQVPLTNTLNRQHFLARASDHPLNAFLAKYESDLNEVASLASTFTDKSMGFGGKLDVRAHLSPTFWQHPALKTLEVKTEQKPVSTLKPLWQYGNNTQQAFRDYMEAKKKGDARAWLYLGVMCLQGVVVPPDYYTAVACFEKARDLGELL